jgi:hypothetical protein
MDFDNLSDFASAGSALDVQTVYQDLANQKGLLTAISLSKAKYFNDGHATVVLKATKLEDGTDQKGAVLWFKALEKSHEIPKNELMRYKFDLPTGHFLFDAPLLRTPLGSLHVDLGSVKLLRLQRRNSFRTPVPEVMAVAFILRKKNKKPNISICRVADLSAAGLAIWCNDPTIKAGDELEGLLKCPQKEDVILTGIVRHSETPAAPGAVHKVGLELINLNQNLSQHLLSMGLLIHRETKNR